MGTISQQIMNRLLGRDGGDLNSVLQYLAGNDTKPDPSIGISPIPGPLSEKSSKPQKTSPLLPQGPSLRDTLIQQLLAGINQGGAPKMKSMAQLRAEAAGVVGAQYDPQIAAIKELMGNAKSDAKVNRKDIQALYADLAGSYKEDNAWLQKELKAAKSNEAKSLGTLTNRMDDTLDAQTADMAADFEKLGISDTLPAATQQMQNDNSFFDQLNATESGAQQRYYDAISAADNSYYNRASSIAGQRGVESVESLLGNLRDYLTQARGEISSLEGQRGAGIAQMLSQLQTAQSQAASGYQNDTWDRMAKMFGIVSQSEGMDFNQQLQLYKLMQQQNGQKPATTGIMGAYDTLSQLLGNNSTNAVSALQNFLQTTTQREATFEGANGQPNKMTAQQAAYEAKSYAEKVGLSPQETTALVQAVYAYYGKLR